MVMIIVVVVVVVVVLVEAVAVILCVVAIVLVVVILVVVVILAVVTALVVAANMSRIPNLPLLLFHVLLMDMLCTCPGFKSSSCCTRQTDRQITIFVFLTFRR